MISLKNREVLFLVIVFCLWAALAPAFLLGQAATAAVTGRVMDSSGAAVPGAVLTVKNTATSATQTVNTDEQGRYTVPDLPIGPYEVTVSKTGFQNAVRTGLTLDVGSAPVLDFQLKVGQATETVNVSAEASQVETTTAAVSSLVNSTQMRELPLNGRNFEQLILLAPGVSTYPAGGSSALTSVANAYSIAGNRPEGYNNTLDGEDVLNWWQRNAGGNVTGTSLGIDSIAEFQTLTGTYGAPIWRKRRGGYRRDQVGYQRVSWLTIRVPPQQRPGLARLFRRGLSAPFPPKPVRCDFRRVHQKEQNLLLRKLRRNPAGAGYDLRELCSHRDAASGDL